jgi:hypothetical protein
MITKKRGHLKDHFERIWLWMFVMFFMLVVEHMMVRSLWMCNMSKYKDLFMKWIELTLVTLLSVILLAGTIRSVAPIAKGIYVFGLLICLFYFWTEGEE